MTNELIHFSEKPIASLDSTRKYEQRVHFKPRGFWFSVEGNGDGWMAWCTEERFNIEALQRKHRLTLRDDARLIRLTSTTNIDVFHVRFNAAVYHRIIYIDWTKVAAQYQGIIINPYIWQRRLDTWSSGWYHSWDCASGCIWDLTAIKEMELIT